MESIVKPKLRFNNSGYYFIGLFVLVILGFWPSYFAKFFDGTADFRFYIHFHAVIMILWVTALIIQPILIIKKKLPLHRLIGKVSYFLFPMMFISIILLIHSGHRVDEGNLDITMFGQFKNFIVVAAAYAIAIKYRHNVDIHARAMVVTGIAIIEPALTRLIYNLFGFFKLFQDTITVSSLIAISLIFALLIGVIMKEGHQKRGRWLFPSTLGLYFILYIIAIFQIHIGLESFSRWFISLPLT